MAAITAARLLFFFPFFLFLSFIKYHVIITAAKIYQHKMYGVWTTRSCVVISVEGDVNTWVAGDSRFLELLIIITLQYCHRQ